MKKKVLSVILAMAMVMTFAAGCGSKEEAPAAEPEAQEEAETEEAEETAVSVEAVDQRRVFVTPEWVQSALEGNQAGYENLVVCQVGYMDTSAYDEAHVPGAIYVDSTEVEDAIGDAEHPYNLLTAEEIRDFALAHGITKDSKVVLYCGDISQASRQALGYLYIGVEDVKILDGGLDAWTAAGFETEAEATTLEAQTDFGCDVPANPQYVVSIADAKDRAANDENFKLVSIRSEAEFLGETSGYSYMDLAGEPEGAVWGKGPDTAFDVNGYKHEDGTALSLSELQSGLWADVDFTVDNDLAFFCGTGWRACVPFMIMYQEGYDNVSIYDGGWYEWIMNPEFPVQVGDPSSDECLHVTVKELEPGKAAK